MRVRRLSFLLSGLLVSACGGSGFTEFQGSAGSLGDTSGGAGGAGGTNGGGGGAGNQGSSGSSTPTSDAAAPDVGNGAGGSAGSAGAAGAGGAPVVDAGSDAPVCTDNDNDNQTTCAGDCNDGDPTVFKGNTEICGDNKDNNCNASIDENCGGLGTYVSNTGDDKNPGTQAMPVKTIAQGMKNAATIGGKQAVFIGEGHYPEKVTMVEGIDLLGGYQCNGQGCTWQRDSTKYDSAILDQDDEGVLVPSTVTSATTIDGVRIAGRSGDPQSAPGSVALTIDGGTPTVTHNVIAGGNVTNSFRSIGIRVIAPSKNASGVLIDKNQISGGTSTGSSSGIFFDQRTFPASGPAVAVVTNNTIRGGNAPNTNGIQAGSAGGKTLVQGNDITMGTSATGNGQSWGIDFGGSLTIDANRINVDRNLVGTCAGSNWCGGIVSRSGTATITNNVVFGPGAAGLSAASMFTEAELPSGSIVLNSNLLDGGGNGAVSSVSAAVVLRIGPCNTCGFNGVVGRIRNNILLGGSTPNRYGLYEETTAGKTEHPQFLENNDFFFPGAARNDNFYRHWNGVVGTMLPTINAVNALGAPSTASGNISVDPVLNNTFHIDPASGCVDKATATDVPTKDFEGDSRPKGGVGDIGPDEAK